MAVPRAAAGYAQQLNIVKHNERSKVLRGLEVQNFNIDMKIQLVLLKIHARVLGQKFLKPSIVD